MRSVRRFYFYMVSLIALEVVVWGVINLARRIFIRLSFQGSNEALATGLAMVLVGLPVFLLHWSTVQRDAHRDDEERASSTRALFFYAALAALLVPVALSVLAILNRLIFDSLGLAHPQMLIGREQTYADNIISIAVNAAISYYFFQLLHRDWLADLPGNALADIRRLYRYLWMAFGLVLLTIGLIKLLHFTALILFAVQRDDVSEGGNAVALLLVGAPLWAFHWLRIQRSLADESERHSRLRMLALYLLAFSGVLMTFFSAISLLSPLLDRLFGPTLPWTSMTSNVSSSLSYLIPGAALWAYFWDRLRTDLEGDPDLPGRAAFSRLYFYLLALLGLGALILGIQRLLISQVERFLGANHTLNNFYLYDQATALAMILVSLPLYYFAWHTVQREAARQDDEGDHARRSTLRKGFLYLVVFITLIGLMASVGRLVYLLVSNVLGSPVVDFITSAVKLLLTAALFAVWFLYHLSVLRADNQRAQRSLGSRHAAFPAVIIQAGNESFTVELVQALQRLAPRLPIAVHRMDLGAPSEDLLKARVVILPAWLAMQPGEAMRLWLSEFQGKRILVPNSLEGWIWLGTLPKNERDLAHETAQAVRQLAEGQEVRLSRPNNLPATIGIILAVILGLSFMIAFLGYMLNSNSF